ncbi:MAG: hypothetical protein QY323_05320 [Patescibacteria group bacterium]|nr:MAG: hypothetical protein QY323_05320 [Patescibacteria group bacterium]
MEFLIALFATPVIVGLCVLLAWLMRAIPHRRYERSIKGLVSNYMDTIARLTVLGPPSFYEITSLACDRGSAYKQWACRIFLKSSLGFALEKCGFEGRWTYRAHFFDPLTGQYRKFGNNEVWGVRSEWFVAKAEMLVQALDAYQRHPLVKTREGSAFNSEAERFQALFRMTDRTRTDFNSFFQNLTQSRSAA